MTTKLMLFNEALLICGERQLTTVTDAVKGRYLLDSVWNNGAVDYCLSSGQWRFATRSQSLDPDPAITPGFGYAHAFQKPSDWTATIAVCSDEYFNSPLLAYNDEAGYWYADIDPLYIRFISNDVTYGTNYAAWPAKFTDYAAHYLASKIVLDLTGDKEKVLLIKKATEKALMLAKNHDAMGDPTRFRRPARGQQQGMVAEDDATAETESI